MYYSKNFNVGWLLMQLSKYLLRIFFVPNNMLDADEQTK